MICGTNGWKLLEPVMAIIDNSSAVEVFVFDEDPYARISINEAIEHLYADRSKISTGILNQRFFDKKETISHFQISFIFTQRQKSPF